MSKSLKVGIIAEGPTDLIVIEAIIRKLVPKKREVSFRHLQPETTESYEQKQEKTGTGWSGVYRQIESLREFGPLEVLANHIALSRFDVLIIHLDVDVSRQTFEDGHLSGVANKNLPRPSIPCPLGKRKSEKPCVENCCIPRQRTDDMQTVLLEWMGITEKPKRIVFCTPCESIEAWILAALFPNDIRVTKKKLECQECPEKVLKSEHKISKSVKKYDNIRAKLQTEWDTARKNCSEADRFSKEFDVATAKTAVG